MRPVSPVAGGSFGKNIITFFRAKLHLILYEIRVYEYRILNRTAFINAVGREKARAWWIESEDNAYPLDIGDYFYRNTGVAGDDRWHWSAMSNFVGGIYRNGDNWFNTKNGRFEVEPNDSGGWITGEDADYTYHFWECVQFYD